LITLREARVSLGGRNFEIASKKLEDIVETSIVQLN
jgi:hypothetical protein